MTLAELRCELVNFPDSLSPNTFKELMDQFLKEAFVEVESPPLKEEEKALLHELYYKHALEYIADVLYDRDGLHTAKDLGELIDEMQLMARNAQRGVWKDVYEGKLT